MPEREWSELAPSERKRAKADIARAEAIEADVVRVSGQSSVWPSVKPDANMYTHSVDAAVCNGDWIRMVGVSSYLQNIGTKLAPQQLEGRTYSQRAIKYLL